VNTKTAERNKQGKKKTKGKARRSWGGVESRPKKDYVIGPQLTGKSLDIRGIDWKEQQEKEKKLKTAKWVNLQARGGGVGDWKPQPKLTLGADRNVKRRERQHYYAVGSERAWSFKEKNEKPNGGKGEPRSWGEGEREGAKKEAFSKSGSRNEGTGHAGMSGGKERFRSIVGGDGPKGEKKMTGKKEKGKTISGRWEV